MAQDNDNALQSAEVRAEAIDTELCALFGDNAGRIGNQKLPRYELAAELKKLFQGRSGKHRLLK